MKIVPLNPNYYCVIDPGGTTGYATYTKHGKVTSNGSIKGHDQFLDWFEALSPSPKIIVVEEYRIRQHQFNHNFSSVPTLQLIGAIKQSSRRVHKVKSFVEQPSANLGIGLRYLGLAGRYGYTRPGEKKKHVPDSISALAHGEYYLIRHKIKERKIG